MLSLNKYLKVSKLLVCLLFLFKSSIAQNLIQNNSFETYTSPIDCGAGGFDNYSTFPVNHVLNNWHGFNSPDYFNSYCTNGPLPNQFGFDVPANVFGYSVAKNGNAYIGISVFQENNLEYKEYLYQQLQIPLVSNEIYCLSFYVSRADRKEYAIKNIGAYFSISQPAMVSSSYINVIPQVLNQNGFLTDTTQWIEIQGCFTAQGGEQYITIGNFRNEMNTDTLRIQSSNPLTGNGYEVAYYYIDDISLIEQTTVGLKDINELRVISIYPNPAKDVLNIDLGAVKENTKIKIYNALGELVLTEDLTTQNSSLKTYHLPSGIYFYRILVGDKVIKNDKIVIIK